MVAMGDRLQLSVGDINSTRRAQRREAGTVFESGLRYHPSLPGKLRAGHSLRRRLCLNRPTEVRSEDGDGVPLEQPMSSGTAGLTAFRVEFPRQYGVLPLHRVLVERSP